MRDFHELPMKVLRICVLVLACLAPSALFSSSTTISTSGTSWQINGQTVQLWSVRVANAMVDDTAVSDLVAMLTKYRAHGIRNLSVSLQGGRTGNGTAGEDGQYQCFDADGTMRTTCQTRLTTILDALDARAMTAQLVVFYFYRDEDLDGEPSTNTAINKAIDETAQWVEDNNYDHVIVDIANEHGDSRYDFTLLSGDSDANRDTLCSRWSAISSRPCSVSQGLGLGHYVNDYELWHDPTGGSGIEEPVGSVPRLINETERYDDYDEPGEFIQAEIDAIDAAIDEAKLDGIGLALHFAWIQGVYEDGTDQGPRFGFGASAASQPSSTDANRSVHWAFDLIATAEGITDADTSACSDGLDNDSDTKADWPSDPGCLDPWDDDEADSAGTSKHLGRKTP